jgi:chromosome partitioning protein
MYKSGSYEAIKGTIPVKEAIQHVDEYDLLASSPTLSNSDVEFANPTDVLKLRKALKEVDDDYDFIIMDTNPARNRLLNMAYIASDYIVVPVEADDASIDGLKAIFNDLKEYNDAGWSDAEVLGVIYCRYEDTNQHKFQKIIMEGILKDMNSNAFIMPVRKCIQATEAKSEGTSMQKGKRYCTASMDYRYIADTIIDMMEEDN